MSTFSMFLKKRKFYIYQKFALKHSCSLFDLETHEQVFPHTKWIFVAL